MPPIESPCEVDQVSVAQPHDQQIRSVNSRISISLRMGHRARFLNKNKFGCSLGLILKVLKRRL